MPVIEVPNPLYKALGPSNLTIFLKQSKIPEYTLFSANANLVLVISKG